MILVDANLLVHAYAREVPQHEAARAWLDEQLNGNFACFSKLDWLNPLA